MRQDTEVGSNLVLVGCACMLDGCMRDQLVANRKKRIHSLGNKMCFFISSGVFHYPVPLTACLHMFIPFHDSAL
ncbi:hypothetical protein XELAEV_18046418mg [Xenopus laevis]|uniref:Uncharacterized protein n=1 Tax=Xenopus laevis TaxID=8355 RepID=A0A974BSX6_XENLA|nr:hypothetical protein XELAEV_18046418mg [Xenopus laevis]